MKPELNKTEIPDWVLERVKQKRGKVFVSDDMKPEHTALVVVDLQNCFMMEGVAHVLVPQAHAIVPNVNRLAKTLRSLGGLVVWIRNSVSYDWTLAFEKLSHPAQAKRRAEAIQPGSVGHALWSELDVRPEDLVVEKRRYSAFIQGGSDIETHLRARKIKTVLVTGTATNVCCDSTARDAVLRDFETVMITDGNAAKTDYEHNAALINFYLSFGDVMSSDQAIGFLSQSHRAVERRAG
jgi:ureidoacrylate peracid hydrolase